MSGFYPGGHDGYRETRSRNILTEWYQSLQSTWWIPVRPEKCLHFSASFLFWTNVGASKIFKEWNHISNCEAYYELVKHMTSQRYPALAWRSNLVTSPGRCQLKFDCRSSRSLIAFMDMARVRSNWKSLLSTMLCNWFWSGEPFYFFQPDWKAFNKSASVNHCKSTLRLWEKMTWCC